MFCWTTSVLADLKYHPITFKISTDKPSYYEGEKITIYITIKNTSKENTYPVLIPHTQNTGQKLFYLTAYDKAFNMIEPRYREDKQLRMLVHDTGTVKLVNLKPLEQLVIPIYLNDFENYYSYHTQNASHHSFGVPLFAGVYRLYVTYNPKGISAADSLYNYYNDFERDSPDNNKLAIPDQGLISPMIELKIKRSADTLIYIERKPYYIKYQGELYFYLSEPVNQVVTDIRCEHITNLPPDSFALSKGEYFYSHFTDLYAEYISRFDDGSLRIYRKYTDYCPDDLYTFEYNEFKQLTRFAQQLPDKRFYEITYHQPMGKPHQETYCSADGTLCTVTTYVYNKKGDLIRKEQLQTQPCREVELDGKKRSYQIVEQLKSN
jgi:predicted transcriptional regulator